MGGKRGQAPRQLWDESLVTRTVESTNREDPAIFPGVKEHSLRQPREIKDGEISKNYRLHEMKLSFNWYDRIDDKWMWRP
jgi:hypothetical protein